VTIDGYEDVPKNDEAALMKAASQQPVAVAICASPAMQFYRGGVISDCCEDLNHGVLLVGYGTDEASGVPYWLVRGGVVERGWWRVCAIAVACILSMCYQALS
jgi:hypothetical protein